MAYYKNSPIRINKINESNQKLTDLEFEQKRKFTPREKIYHIFAYKFKHLDTEEEEDEKGVSLRELALILYPERITIEEMIVGEKDEHVFSEKVWPAIQNTRQSINRFKKWQLAISDEDGQSIDETGFNLYCLRTRKGHYYYYNLMNDKDLDIVELHKAKTHLGLQKSINRILDFLDMRPEEIEERQKKMEEKMLQQLKVQKEKAMKKAKTSDEKP